MPNSPGAISMRRCKPLHKAFLPGWPAAAFLLVFLSGPAMGVTMIVEDALGKISQISLPVRRIVVLNSDVLEVLRILKAQNLVVGVCSEVAREPEFWGALASRPKVGGWRSPNLEAIVKLEPDLVIAYHRNPGREFDRRMAALGIQVLRLDFYRIEILEQEVHTLGRILDRQPQAARFCDWHRRHLEMIWEKLAWTGDRPPVYIESYTDYHAAGPGSGGDEMCILAGGRNIAAGFTIPYPQVTPEWVLSQNPEVIIKAVANGNGYALKNSSPFNRRRDAILRRPAWRYIAAVATGKVHVMDSAIWTGPRALIGIAYMAKWFYPGLFQDLHPEELHKEYLETFQGVEYRGVFVSKPVRDKRR